MSNKNNEMIPANTGFLALADFTFWPLPIST